MIGNPRSLLYLIKQNNVKLYASYNPEIDHRYFSIDSQVVIYLDNVTFRDIRYFRVLTNKGVGYVFEYFINIIT